LHILNIYLLCSSYAIFVTARYKRGEAEVKMDIDIVVYQSEELLNVQYFFHPVLTECIGVIKLCFENKVFFIIVNPSDDTLEITEENQDQMLKEKNYKCVDVSEEIPWNSAIGNRIDWMWELINQQNYLDGLQFEFANKENRKKPTIIQMIAISSAIEIRIVTVMDKIT